MRFADNLRSGGALRGREPLPGLSTDGATALPASDASDYITGQTIVVDGGWLVSGQAQA